MGTLNSLSACVRRIKARAASGSTDDGAHDGTNGGDVSPVYRFLRLVKLILTIIATALTIARMLGWL